ncbi:RBBP9/YdeN family alpha/beta hydrolase [Ensifer soli]|uniref:RBBP9/YdeN family alpha/beta hydrolase n=1 Tax=Ciceribacter sp. sgz301302 TaxID=3342379 RepID=UPI0035B80F90
MTATLILPGYLGSGRDHWQSHWLMDDASARQVEQEDWARPDLDLWLERLERAVSAHDGVLLVAHSLGCLLAARLAASPLAARVRGALLVAACDPAVTEARHPGAIRFGTPAERPLPFPSTLVASRNDPYMPFAGSARLAALWGSTMVDLGESGHINVDSGFGRWPMGYRLARLLFRPRDPAEAAFAPAAAFRGLVRDRRLAP